MTDPQVAQLRELQASRAQAIVLGALPERLQRRVAEAEVVAPERAEYALQALDRSPLVKSLMSLATQKGGGVGPAERVKRLWRLADAWAREVAPHSACTKGCAHCCHIPVSVFAAEAKVIGQAVGVKPAEFGMAGGVGEVRRREVFGYDHPCPFLKTDSAESGAGGGVCGIYEHRPLASQVQFNMDAVPTLCELMPEPVTPVPLMNHVEFDVAAARQLGRGGVADIRDWCAGGGGS